MGRYKKEEKNETRVYESLERIPKSLPALIKANKIQKKSALVGFDWDNVEDIFKKINEEYQELLDECKQGDIKYIKKELGDLIFSVVNLARFLEIDPEEALNITNNKFIRRFKFMEESAYSKNIDFESMDISDKERLWQEAKKYE